MYEPNSHAICNGRVELANAMVLASSVSDELASTNFPHWHGGAGDGARAELRRVCDALQEAQGQMVYARALANVQADAVEAARMNNPFWETSQILELTGLADLG
ncbi:hypothetical protein [Schaalia vaccimaxillae]|uniref:hypothetical protein n=1 Tax=Schaalia vaccimaxillae TaxID=183916 RepID=UPI0003B61EE8|nr:hypothetical protein [Schaalia vaccimaxillae]